MDWRTDFNRKNYLTSFLFIYISGAISRINNTEGNTNLFFRIMTTNPPSEFLLSITNRKQDQTFSVPVNYEELAQIIQGVALYDNRLGTMFDGITGAYEQYFDLINPNNFTNEITETEKANVSWFTSL